MSDTGAQPENNWHLARSPTTPKGNPRTRRHARHPRTGMLLQNTKYLMNEDCL